jgi:hypothetical protein
MEPALDSLLFSKINQLPEALKTEAIDFIDFLISKSKKKEREPVKKSKRQFGSLKGKIVMSPDFDEPLEDFKDYM